MRKRIIISIFLTTVLFGSVHMYTDVNAAYLNKIMHWGAINAVGVSTATDVLGDTNFATVFVYGSDGVVIGAADNYQYNDSDATKPAAASIDKIGTKKAKGVHYAKDVAGTVYGYKEYTRDRGVGYNY